MWSSSSGERVQSYPLAFVGAFDPGGSTIVTGAHTETAAFLRVLDTDSGEEVRFIRVPWLNGFAVSPDGSVIAAGEEYEAVALWDAASGTRLRTLHVAPSHSSNSVDDIAFGPDGKLVAGVAADALFVWNVASGRIVLDLTAHGGFAGSVTFGPDGSKIATSGGDGAAVWDATSGDPIARLTGVGLIGDVTFSPDGRLLATAGDDGAARIWDVASGRETLSLGGVGEGLGAVAFSPDGTKLATAELDGILRVYVLPIDELLRLARTRVTRGFTDRECRQYLHLASCPPSLARPPGGPPASRPPAQTEPLGPEGAYRVTVQPGDPHLHVLSKTAINDFAGDYTLSIVGGSWRLHQERLNDGTFDTSGTYAVDGRTITFTDRYDLRCFGMSWTGRWMLHGMELSLASISSTTTPTCEPQALNDSILQAVFGSRPWQRVNHHALGG